MPCSPLRAGLRACVLPLVVLLCAIVDAAPAAAQLTVAIEANPGVAVPGEQLEVRVTVANQGVANVAGVVLNLPIPAEIDTFLTGVATSAAGGCTQITNNFACQSGETLIWNFGTISAGQSVTASLTPIVSAGAVGPIVFNPLLNSGPSASASVAIDAGLTLDVSLNEAAAPVAAGGALAYSLHFGNRSTLDTAPDALLRLPLPAGTTFVSASDGGVFVGGAVEWTLGTLQPGQSGTRSVALAVGAGLPRGGSVLATATLSDTSPQLAQARAVTEIDGLEALKLAMVVGPDPAAPGEQLDIELTVSNTSASAVPTVTLLLRWPQEITPNFTGQGTGFPGGCTQILNNFGCSAGEFSVWSLGTLAAGQSVTVSYSAALAAVPDGAIVDFRATVQSANLDERAEAGRSIAVDASSPLDVSLHEALDPVAAGDDLTYTIAFGNRSTTDMAPNALLRFPLPAGTTFVSTSGGGVLNAGAVEWSLGALHPGQSGTRSVTLEIAAGLVSGTLLQTDVALTDTSLPPQLARARAVTEIDALGALELAMVVGPDPAAPGEQLDIELTVSNTSATPLTTVTLQLRWPHEIAPNLTGQGTGSPGGCTQILNDFGCSAGEFSQWSLGTLAPGRSVTVSYSAALTAAPNGSIVEFEAVAQSAATLEQVRAGRAVAVDASRPLELGLHEALDPLAAGDDLAYTLSFINRSRAYTAPNALLRFPLPIGTTFVSATDGGAFNDGAVEWSLGSLPPGRSGTRGVVLATNAGLVTGSLIQADALLIDASPSVQRARAGGVTEIDGLEALEASISVVLDHTDWAYQVDVTVTNTDVVTHTGVTLTLRIPRDAVGFATGTVTGAPTAGCTQIVNNFACSAGEFLLWSPGTLTSGQSVTVRIPNLYIQVPATDSAELFALTAIALGSGTDDRAVDRVVPEPRTTAALVVGTGLLGLLSRFRRRSADFMAERHEFESPVVRSLPTQPMTRG